MWRNGIHIVSQVIEGAMQYNRTQVLTYKIAYPQFVSAAFWRVANRLSLYYLARAQALERYYRTKLYSLAVKQYLYAMENNFPFFPYQGQQDFHVPYLHNRVASLYFDRYEYTGGAHGNTVRSSDTWNVQTGRRITLAQLFPPFTDYRAYLIAAINAQIAKQIEEGSNYYFENYKENVNNTFNENSFYLTHQGVVIYFQQYDIAPYAAGIPEFIIPYSPQGPIRPV